MKAHQGKLMKAGFSSNYYCLLSHVLSFHFSHNEDSFPFSALHYFMLLQAESIFYEQNQ